MPSFSDSIFLFILALLLFGPKKLPVLARELGKWVGEFRRASNEFRMQMEEELRSAEQADRQKQIAAMEAAAPVAPPLETAEHPHLPAAAAGTETQDPSPEIAAELVPEPAAAPAPTPAPAPLPIATSGSLSIMPPATGLPAARTNAHPLGGGLLDSIPQAETAADDAADNINAVPEGELHAR